MQVLKFRTHKKFYQKGAVYTFLKEDGSHLAEIDVQVVPLARRLSALVTPVAFLLLPIVRRSAWSAEAVLPVGAVFGVDHQVRLGEVSVGEDGHRLVLAVQLGDRHLVLFHAQPGRSLLFVLVVVLEPP